MKYLTTIVIHQFTRHIHKPTQLQLKYVYATYEAIAEHFNHTRFAQWPKVSTFINSLEIGSIIYDIGCGNGKYLYQPNHYMLGLDRSQQLAKLVKQKNSSFQIITADALKVPIRNQACDAVLSIAVLHHLSNRQLRIQAIRQIQRILIKQGLGLIYVWCYEQTIKNMQILPIQYKTSDKTEQDMFINWNLQNKFIDKNQTDLEYRYCLQKNTRLVSRYYHLFKEGQLQSLIREVKGLRIESSYYDKQNWCCIVRKISV